MTEQVILAAAVVGLIAAVLWAALVRSDVVRDRLYLDGLRTHSKRYGCDCYYKEIHRRHGG